MRLTLRRASVWIGICGAAVASSQACTNDHLALFTQTALVKASASYCTIPSTQLQGNIKYVLIMDRSGSNQLPPDSSDPNGSRRFPPMIKFVQQNPQSPNVFWSMINMGTSGSILQPFTTDQGSFVSLLQNQQAITATIDNQWTNYVDALDKAQTLIANDIAASRGAATGGAPAPSTTYVLFFVTDGFPIVANGPQSAADILAVVSTMQTLGQQNTDLVSGILLNTALYYSNSPPLSAEQVAATSLLSSMATAGHGTLVSFGAGQLIDYSQFAVPLRNLRYQNRQVWIENENVVWEGGKLVADSDGDGISDATERALGSNPFLVDSDGNGVGDGVEMALNGRPCQDAACAPGAKANPYTTCLSLKTAAGFYPDSDKDGLNDCEELLIGSNGLNPDTNGDLVPDAFAFRHALNLVGPSQLGSSPTTDGLTNYQKLMQGLPLLTPIAQLVQGYSTISYRRTLTSSTPSQDCYQIDVTSVPTLSRTDKVRVYLVDTTELILQKELVRKAEKTIVNGQVQFSGGDFL